MNMKLIIPISVVAGLTITLVTGLLNVTPMQMVGATWHGWPLAWFYVIVYPGSPTSVDWPNLIGDIIVWSVIVLIVALVISKFHKATGT